MKITIKAGEGETIMTGAGIRVEDEEGRSLTKYLETIHILPIGPDDIIRAELVLALTGLDIECSARIIGPDGREVSRIEYADGTVDDFTNRPGDGGMVRVTNMENGIVRHVKT